MIKGLTSDVLRTIALILTTEPTCSDFRLLRGKILDFDPGPGTILS